MTDLSKWLEKTSCPDCGIDPGNLHLDGCDVARCRDCGGQLLSHGILVDCAGDSSDTWTGVWPGVAEAIEFGWFTNSSFPGGVMPDLNRMHWAYGEVEWCKEQERWVRVDA